MRFLFDESADHRLIPFLQDLGHDVVSARVHGRSLEDAQVLAIAHAEQRILVASDLDFGSLVFQYGQPHSGVLLLRFNHDDADLKRQRLTIVLAHHAHEMTGFMVVDEHQVRVR